MTAPDLIEMIGRAGPAPARVDIDPGSGWRHLHANLVSVWFKGDGRGAETGSTPSEHLVRTLIGHGMTAPDPASVVASLSGHFALAATGPGWALAAVDRVRSTPLLFARTTHGPTIATAAGRLTKWLPDPQIDGEAALALAMAGVTIGTDTLYRDVHLLAPGEALVVVGEGEPVRQKYHRFEPWRGTTTATNGPALGRRLTEVLLAGLERLAGSGRPIAVLLDGSVDGWLVASGLKHLGCRDVRCYSVGPTGNAIVEAGRRFAAALGYRWRWMPAGTGTDRAAFATAKTAFVDAADAACAPPIGIDLAALVAFDADGWLPTDAVVVNGGAGFDPSGSAIPSALHRPCANLDAEGRRRLVVDALLAGQFRLWASLATFDRLAQIRGRLERLLDPVIGTAGHPDGAVALFDYADFHNRVGKASSAGPRTAEAVDRDWRLPLVEDDALAFWMEAPPSAKAGQRLLRETLVRTNWAGVWTRWPIPAPTRRAPRWLRWLAEPALTTVVAPLSRDGVARRSRHVLDGWFTDPAMRTAVRLADAARDRRGAGSGQAWLTETYLRRHGLDYAGNRPSVAAATSRPVAKPASRSAPAPTPQPANSRTP